MDGGRQIASMKRRQLIEIHDQDWCPRAVRDGVTDFLQYAANHWNYYAAVLPTICYFLDRLKVPRVIDLCSGGGGPWPGSFAASGPCSARSTTFPLPRHGRSSRTR